ncbi:hypothetical protein QCA50_019346 [Cerrena zonata]|uniref:Uncharacterized protein n=1 Tax=Cerrena zonata TaxID=2478898 RepID=A0AAW0F9A4_9APHY
MVFVPFVSGWLVYFSNEHPVHKLPAEIKSHTLTFCDFPTLVGLYHDRSWRELVTKEVALSFTSTLSTLTHDPAAFRDMMRRTNSIISGQTALYFLLREVRPWKPASTDLLTTPTYFETALTFISGLPGASITYDSAVHNQHQLERTIPSLRMVRVTTPMAIFDITTSGEHSPFHPIAHYWSTLVMNALTADFVICAYPTLTFSRQGVIQFSHPPSPVIEKYKHCGFTLSTGRREAWDLTQSCSDFVACGSRDRYFGDKATLVFPIFAGVGDVDHSVMEKPDADVTTAWKLGGRPCGNAGCFVPSERVVITMTSPCGWKPGLTMVERH